MKRKIIIIFFFLGALLCISGIPDMGNAETTDDGMQPADARAPIEERCSEIILSEEEMDIASLLDDEVSCEELEKLLEGERSDMNEAAEEEDGVSQEESAEDIEVEPELEMEAEPEEIMEEVGPNDEEEPGYEEESSEDVKDETEEDSDSAEDKEVERTDEERIVGEEVPSDIKPSDKIEVIDEPVNVYLQSVERETIMPMQSSGLANLRVLRNINLDATLAEDNGNHIITLTYTGQSILNLELLNTTTIIFYLPTEIANAPEVSYRASYKVPRLLGSGRGTFDEDEIHTDGNQIHMDLFSLLSLSLLGIGEHEYTLTIELGELPPTQTGEYVFYSEATSEYVADLSLLSDQGVASATLPAPELIYSFHSVPENIAFQTTEINPGLVRIPRQDPDWAIEVMDTRVQGSPIRILAEEERPLQTRDGSHTLRDALVYVDGNGESTKLSNGAVEVYSGETGSNSVTEISWAPDEGILVEVDPASAYAADYRGSITWTLVDAP